MGIWYKNRKRKGTNKAFLWGKSDWFIAPKFIRKILPSVEKHTLKIFKKIYQSIALAFHTPFPDVNICNLAPPGRQGWARREKYRELKKTRATAHYEETPPEGNKENKLGGGARWCGKTEIVELGDPVVAADARGGNTSAWVGNKKDLFQMCHISAL